MTRLPFLFAALIVGLYGAAALCSEPTQPGPDVLLIVVAPGLAEPGSRCSRPVSLLDLYPTVCDLCSLPLPAELDGRSLRSHRHPRVLTAWWHAVASRITVQKTAT
jgi:hypothetical protein